MGIRPQTLVNICLLGVACAATWTQVARAQEVINAQPFRITIPEAFDAEFPANNGSRSIIGQFNDFFGLFGTPEGKIFRSAQDIHYMYRQVMYQQTSLDPILRVQDLPSPFDTSVRSLPGSFPNSRVVGSELVFERNP